MSPPPKLYVCSLALLYLAAMLWISGLRPLWLDEILQLMDTRRPSASDLVAHLPAHHTGSAPLAYLTQHWTLKLAGYSVRRARLSSALFATAAVLTTLLLATALGCGNSRLAALLLAFFPLTIRYATEARPYADALFFSTLATWLYVRLSQHPRWILAVAYWLALTAAAYSQPYAASVGLAHVAWSLLCRERKTALLGGGAVTAAIGAFLPWYLYARDQWAAGLGPHGPHFTASWKLPLMLFRELAGAGYAGSGLLFILCGLALVDRTVRPGRTKALLLLLIGVPFASVLSADALFGYFVAARQFLWVLPSIAILAADTLRPSRLRMVLLACFLAVCIRQNVRFLSAPHENWQAAADAIRHIAQTGACLTVVPPEHLSLYAYFQPDLSHTACDGSHLLLAITPYATREQQTTALAALRSQGYLYESKTSIGGSTLVRFDRPAPPLIPPAAPPSDRCAMPAAPAHSWPGEPPPAEAAKPGRSSPGRPPTSQTAYWR